MGMGWRRRHPLEMIRRGIRVVCICFKKELRMQGALDGLVLMIYDPVQFPLFLLLDRIMYKGFYIVILFSFQKVFFFSFL